MKYVIPSYDGASVKAEFFFFLPSHLYHRTKLPLAIDQIMNALIINVKILTCLTMSASVSSNTRTGVGVNSVSAGASILARRGCTLVDVCKVIRVVCMNIFICKIYKKNASDTSDNCTLALPIILYCSLLVYIQYTHDV